MKCHDCGKEHRGIAGLMPKQAGMRIVGEGPKPEGRYQKHDDGMPGKFGHMRYRMLCKDCLEKLGKPKEEADYQY